MMANDQTPKADKVFAVIWCVINLALIGGVGGALLFTPVKFFGFIIMTGAMYVVNGIIGLCYRFIPNAKDHSGELIL